MDRILADPVLKAAHENAVKAAVEKELHKLRQKRREEERDILYAVLLLLERDAISDLPCKRQYALTVR